MEKNKPVFKQSEVARIKGVSDSYVSKAVSGEITTDKAQDILQMLSVTNNDIIIIIKNPLFYEMCDVAIDKPKVTKEVRKFAALCQQFHTILNNNTNK